MRASDIFEGPLGLTKIDFYKGPIESMHVERDRAVLVTNGYFVKVNNAFGLRLADAYFTGPEEEWEQAKQWLFDMVTLRSEE